MKEVLNLLEQAKLRGGNTREDDDVQTVNVTENFLSLEPAAVAVAVLDPKPF